jgi:GNAT superfamily N-acetyltransferase
VSKIQAPAPLSIEHQLNEFDCNEPSLNDWLKKNVLKNNASGASRCFVICEGHTVIGYYSLSAGAITRQDAPKSMQRNMPDTLPIVLLGRLAIDKKHQNKGLGKALLRDAMLRVVNASTSVGVFAILLHALSEQAKRFYLSCGFVQSPLQSMTLMMTLKTIQNILTEDN